MTQEKIFELAKLAGFEIDDSGVLSPQVLWYIFHSQLEVFAQLVAAAEREACEKVLRDKAMSIEKEAQIADEEGDTEGVMALRSSAWLISVCEAEIRARGQQ